MNLKRSKYLFYTERSVGEKQCVYLLFSGRSAKNIMVSKEVYERVLNNEFESLSVSTKELFIENKILVEQMEDEYAEVNRENRNLLNNKKNGSLYISIQPTAVCQLACDYCGQAHSKKYLNDKHISAIVNRVNKKLSTVEFDSLQIGWFGGEPLCSLKNMLNLNEQLKAIASSHKVQYGGQLTTNGYALSPALYSRMKNEFNMRKIEITLDGSKEFHNQRRFKSNGEGSFDRIFKNIISIISSPAYDFKVCPISIRCNVDERNVKGVMPLLKLLVDHQLQNKVNFYTAPVVSWSNNGAGSKSGQSLLGRYSTEFIAFMIEYGFHVAVLPKRAAPYTCIGTDEHAEMYDAEGYIFDCSETSYSDYYAEQGYILGNVMYEHTIDNKGSKIRAVPEKLLNGEIAECRNCKFYPLCGGMCPLALIEGTPRCPSFIYNIEDRMFLDYIERNRRHK